MEERSVTPAAAAALSAARAGRADTTTAHRAGARRTRDLRWLGWAAAALSLTVAAPGLAKRPAPRAVPRTPEAISQSLQQSPHKGECGTCHSLHGEQQPQPQAPLLQGPNDNALCLNCHSTPWAGGSLPGSALYAGSSHGSSRRMVWPGPSPPARGEPDAAGKCLNCHDPHGWQDNAGVIPFLAIGREQKLCYQCHDGAPASTNIWSDFQLPYRHPAGDRADVHRGPTEAAPEDFGFAPEGRRHAECPDCHNPHVARGDGLTAAPGTGPKSLLGVSRVAVVNGPAGSAPAFTFVPGRDTLSYPGGEYQVCFKCHSSWTTQPPGQPDLAALFNTNNRSFHPVEAAGRNPNIRAGAFTGTWNGLSRMTCSDCHGGDVTSAAGPHGSVEAHILRRRYEMTAFGGGPPPSGFVPSPMPGSTADPGQLCFLCHQYDVYANSGAAAGVLAQSRFNPPDTAGGHAKHVLEYGVSCYACHDSHGVADQPHLIATGRTPGIMSFTEGPTGGDCGPSCHVPRTYAINYPR